jgi:hypothetical protein
LELTDDEQERRPLISLFQLMHFYLLLALPCPAFGRRHRGRTRLCAGSHGRCAADKAHASGHREPLLDGPHGLLVAPAAATLGVDNKATWSQSPSCHGRRCRRRRQTTGHTRGRSMGAARGSASAADRVKEEKDQTRRRLGFEEEMREDTAR